MDIAYDHIQEEALKPEDASKDNTGTTEQSNTLNTDFQEAYKAISSSPWGAKLGGFFGSVVKQGESVYKEASQELSSLGEDAVKGATGLRSTILSRTRALSLSQNTPGIEGEKSIDATIVDKDAPTDEALRESEGVLARLRSEAAKRLKDIQEAEDAADEALLKFGTNIRNFLRDAVVVAAPSTNSEGTGSTILFESKDASGKRVIHTTRFDAQLHVIHSTLDSFTKDPASAEYEPWAKEFDAEKKTGDISQDLEKYEELRSAMEKLVPERVEYSEFWKRYYFLRHSIETAEARRRDLLKGAAASAEAEEEVGWDEDSDDEADKTNDKPKPPTGRPASVASATTIQPKTVSAPSVTLQPSEPRKSHDEKSQADSDASYDVVGATSGVTSRAPGSPKESKKGDDSEEEDWE